MDIKEKIKETTAILEKLGNGGVHYPPGFFNQQAERLKAQHCIKTNELEAIYHLVESHVSGLRARAILRFEKKITLLDPNNETTLGKRFVELNCTNRKMEDNINDMLEKVRDMPSEWTLVQLTPQYNCNEFAKIDINTHYTNSLYLTVFNCGKDQLKPFCVSVKAPRDNVTGAAVQLMDELYSIAKDNKNILACAHSKTHFNGVPEKECYYAKRFSIDDRLKMLVKDFQDLYLKEWKCFLMGKYDDILEKKIQNRIKHFFKTELPNFNLDEKTLYVIHYLIKSAGYLKLGEIKRALEAVIPSSTNKDIYKQLTQFIRNVYNDLSLSNQQRRPIILILDDSLDCFPWEMMEILADVQVTRLPSLHIAYALFQEHKDSIKEGFKIVSNPEKGHYILNPDKNLNNMENRIGSFYEYWLPDWKGVAGSKPTYDEFEKSLLSADIFAYNGHGNGSHLFSLKKIESRRVNAVILLFGCNSTKLTHLGCPVEMFSMDQFYLIACSPCIVGNLWEVTDLDTDVLTTEFLSRWIPNPRKKHWKSLDKSQWRKGEKVDFGTDALEVPSKHLRHESHLVKALSYAKKSSKVAFYITKAALVVRGLPVKIITK